MDQGHTSVLNSLPWVMHAIGLATVVGACLASYFALYAPLSRLEGEKEYAARKLDRLLLSADKVRSEHAKIKASLAGLERQAASIRRRVPDGAEEGDFLRHVTEAAADQRIKILDYRRGVSVASITHSQLELELKCQGNYAGICGFLDRLSRMPRTFAVKQMEINSQDPHDFYPFDLTIVLYFGMKPGSTASATGTHG